MTIHLPELSLVVLIGPSGAGKSTFARRHFKATEILSSDFCRGLVCDDETDQGASEDAFAILHAIAARRLARGCLTVIDATNVQPESRRPLVELARQHHVLPVAIVFDLPERVCVERNRGRSDRDFGPHVIRQQAAQMRRHLRRLDREGFRQVRILRTEQEVETAAIARQPLWNNLRHEHGPFDIIGDVHGCLVELLELLATLGWEVACDGRFQAASAKPVRVCYCCGPANPARTDEAAPSADLAAPPPSGVAAEPGAPVPAMTWRHSQGRKAVFLGDLVDRGPDSPGVLRLVMDMVESGAALCVPGNHDVRLMRKLRGRNVKLTHGLEQTLQQLEGAAPQWIERIAQFIDGLISHYVLDDGKLVVAHAGMKESMQGRGSGTVREFALHGETTGEIDEFGLPVRINWAADYRGRAMVVYGHTPVVEPEWLNRTINIDTGCVFGGKLTALLYPDLTLAQVQAHRTYAQAKGGVSAASKATSATDAALPPDGPGAISITPAEIGIGAAGAADPAGGLSAQQMLDELLDIRDVLGKRIIETRLLGRVTIREENAAAALEVMSRFAVNPKWLIYLPPTMSPCETSHEPDLLEHPAEAFDYFRREGVTRVICEEKHMGSRAVVVICRDEDAARRRFGVLDEGFGVCVTRTGRRFFDAASMERRFLEEIRAALDACGFWDEFKTTWVCLDGELMPWSAKALGLLKAQYAAVGAAAAASAPQALDALGRAAQSGLEVTGLLDHQRQRQQMVRQFVEAYRRYCWSVGSVAELKFAPFHVLATQGAAHADRDHVWHMETLRRLCAGTDVLLMATPYRVVDLDQPGEVEAGIDWWQELTARGGEGMVVKPVEFVVRHGRKLVQPALKCRGREYLRIIYGAEYTRPEHLARLRHRATGRKRSLALREFALGIEALERFVARQPLRRVHECVFGVLAMESEPVDPRL